MKNFIYNFAPLLAVTVMIAMIVISFMFTLADVASKPAAHSASYAVRHNPYPYSSLVLTDQGRATLVSLSGTAPDHLYGVINE